MFKKKLFEAGLLFLHIFVNERRDASVSGDCGGQCGSGRWGGGVN